MGKKVILKIALLLIFGYVLICALQAWLNQDIEQVTISGKYGNTCKIQTDDGLSHMVDGTCPYNVGDIVKVKHASGKLILIT